MLKKRLAWTAAFVAGLILIRIFLFSIYSVKGISMKNSLLHNDVVLINKYKSCSHGHIAVFKRNDNTYIKRCVGGPGDEVEMREGSLFVNGKMVLYRNEVSGKSDDNSVNAMIVEQFGMPWSLDSFGPVKVPKIDDTIVLNEMTRLIYGPVIIEEMHLSSNTELNEFYLVNSRYSFKNDYFFMLGDNRNFSDDSRVLGFVPKKALIGVAEVILFNRFIKKRVFKRIAS